MGIPSIVVVGGINTDYMAQGPELPSPGAMVQGTYFREGPGGKGANQAVAAARLGARVSLVARLGNDARGDALLKHLQDESVDTRYVVRDREQPTGAALIQVDESGEKQILAAPGVNDTLTVDDVRAAADAICAARIILAQLEVPLECVLEAARLAHQVGARFVLDPAPARPGRCRMSSFLCWQ